MSEPITTTETPVRERNLRKTRVGEVVSDAMDKTIVVSTVTRVPHKKFGKIIKHVKKFYVHDEKNEAKVGDRVSIMETRPLSRLKRWRLVEVLKH
ncbi:MAG TPA: 30S ribosomal protein S17 [Terrimicrobiaceae bacterium]|jgi:small subunit ribosomal protein S17|nr:30S ribosomal protein S17 [Terrimicrobiaceae bacterium]